MIFGELRLLAVGKLGEAGVYIFKSLKDDSGYKISRIPLIVCRQNIPRTVLRGGFIDGLLINLLVILPQLTLA